MEQWNEIKKRNIDKITIRLVFSTISKGMKEVSPLEYPRGWSLFYQLRCRLRRKTNSERRIKIEGKGEKQKTMHRVKMSPFFLPFKSSLILYNGSCQRNRPGHNLPLCDRDSKIYVRKKSLFTFFLKINPFLKRYLFGRYKKHFFFVSSTCDKIPIRWI